MSMPYTAAMMAAANVSLADLERYRSWGLISKREFTRAYVFACWCAPRMGGDAGRRQDAFWNARGKAAYERRIAAVRRLYYAMQPRGREQWEIYHARCTLPARAVRDWGRYPKRAA